MTLNRSLFRFAALTGVAAFLFSFAHVRPAAAQTRHTTYCDADASSGQTVAQCNMTVPAGKVFVIENASVTGTHPSAQYMYVVLITKALGANRIHAVPAGFQVLSNTQTIWSGALPGTVFSDPGTIKLYVSRGPSTIGTMWFQVTLTGHLEDM